MQVANLSREICRNQEEGVLMAQCPNCGAQAPGKFCPNCGTQVPQTPPIAAAAMQPQQAPPPVPSYSQPGQPPQYGVPTPPPGYQAPYPNPYQQVPPQKAGSSALKIILIVVGALVGLFALLIGVAMVLPDDPAVVDVPAAGSPVSMPVITDQVDAQSQKPLNPMLTVPSSTDSIYAAIEVHVKEGQVLGAKWYYNDRLQDHLNTDLAVPRDYQGWASFDVGNGEEPWPAGRYRVEIYLDGALQHGVNFTVK
jgi:hypothetical protein